MPGIVRLGDKSLGHDGYPPTPVTIPNNATFFVNGKLAATVGGSFATHTKPKSPTHFEGAERVITSGSNTFFIEGNKAARHGDSVADNDSCDECSPDCFIN